MRNTNIKRFLVVTTSILLVACVTKYEAPLDGPSAQIRFMQSHFPIAAVVYYDGDPCKSESRKQMGAIGGWGGSEAYNRNGMPGRKDWDFQQLLERKIPAGKQITVGVEFMKLIGRKGSRCKIGMSFVPTEGQLYEAEYLMDKEYCYLPIYKITVNEDGLVSRSAPIPTTKVDFCDNTDKQ